MSKWVWCHVVWCNDWRYASGDTSKIQTDVAMLEREREIWSNVSALKTKLLSLPKVLMLSAHTGRYIFFHSSQELDFNPHFSERALRNRPQQSGLWTVKTPHPFVLSSKEVCLKPASLSDHFVFRVPSDCFAILLCYWINILVRY